MPIAHDKIWQALVAHQRTLSSRRMTALFAKDSTRAERYRIKAAGLLLDYSKNIADDDTLNLFSRLIDANTLPEQIQQVFDGARINSSENRPALHTLLRARENGSPPDHLRADAEVVALTLARMKSIATAIRNKTWKSHNGKPIRQIVHLGIGGSYLGPSMVTEALAPYATADVTCHFVANVDGHHIDSVLKRIDPDETLVIIASKTFTTLETMINAQSTRQWLLGKIPAEGLDRHQIAVTGNREAARAWGITAENTLPVPEWVGGRYSLWSAVGLPVAIACGFDTFRALLDGAAAMDEHFREAPWPDNMPMMMGLLGIWYNNFFGTTTHAVLPYDHRLRSFPAHLQQLDMESNGKSVTARGEPVDCDTGPGIWGGEETNGQHAFHQWLHQGTRFTDVDFIVPITPHHDRTDHHHWLVANCLAQGQALMVGRTIDDIAAGAARPHKVMPGNRPSNTILLDKLTPQCLGALTALYEHKVLCQALIWHINPFDQWGVELGKELGKSVYETITGSEPDKTTDASTAGLIEYYRSKFKT